MKTATFLLLLTSLALAHENYKELPHKMGYNAAISECKKLGDVWRLPEIWELFSLRGQSAAFGIDKRYWSATSLKETRTLNIHTSSDESYIKKEELPAFAFYLQDGDVTPTPKEINAFALCTNLPKNGQSEEYFQVQKNGVDDKLNNIIWEPLDNKQKANYEEAKDICEFKKTNGKSWRLPSVDELYSLVNYNYIKPALNTEIFSKIQNKYYWSDDAFSAKDAYVVGFSIGSVATSPKEEKSYFRCVSDKE
ncbi:MAG TPA: hypothetical protein CFH84_03145 [Sulfurimonas sp. UBA12504]|nr:MAG: hypothetical protein A2019_09770 [Sulfurimonas sp. GWF2_37_8]DAB30602.1 MAG TPA: hypothetical protein CFH84_03145 [Sulfurimonas sp. UBA12504]